MTQDNKDAALELAKELDIPLVEYILDPEKIINYYNAARKPLEEKLETFRDDFAREAFEHERCKQQLLATQESYQRVVGAVQDFVTHSYEHGVEGGDIVLATCESREMAVKALDNPPSLEMVERKKLEDEIAVLEELNSRSQWRDAALINMIAERKAKLEKMR